MFYMGNEFNKETNKEYKTEEGGKKAAEKNLMCLFDDDGKTIADFRPEPEQEAVCAEDVTVTMTDNVPEDAAADNDVKIYNKDGQQMGTISPAALDKLMEIATDGEEIRLKGKVRRKFNGALRLRNRPSWDASAVAGTTVFTEKTVVAALTVDEKPMYKTKDGYYITGDPDMVEYIAE